MKIIKKNGYYYVKIKGGYLGTNAYHVWSGYQRIEDYCGFDSMEAAKQGYERYIELEKQKKEANKEVVVYSDSLWWQFKEWWRYMATEHEHDRDLY